LTTNIPIIYKNLKRITSLLDIIYKQEKVI